MKKNAQILIKNTSQYQSSDAFLLPSKERWRSHLLIGYCGDNDPLRFWANNQARRLEIRKYNIPERFGGSVAQTRLYLWQGVQKNFIDYCLEPLLESLRSGKIVTLWFLNYRDVEMARLLRRYLEYCLESGLFLK